MSYRSDFSIKNESCIYPKYMEMVLTLMPCTLLTDLNVFAVYYHIVLKNVTCDKIQKQR